MNQADPIGAEIEARVKTRTVALGAETDLGAQVYRGATKITNDMPPCCVIVEGDPDVSPQNVRTNVKVVQPYGLLAYVPCDPQQPALAAHKALRDLKRAIFRKPDGSPDWNLGGAARQVEYRGHSFAPRESGAAIVVVGVEVVVEYAEDLSNP